MRALISNVARAMTAIMLAAVVVPTAVRAASEAPATQVIQRILDSADSIDLARAKLELDRLVDPTINVEQTLSEVDSMIVTLQSLVGANATDREKITALQRYLYVSGVWNNYKPFEYDQRDPLGKNLSNKLLSKYLSTRQGNCVSMPLLFIILADRLGLKATASLAPQHVFVKYTDESAGRVFNLETTSGAHVTRDEWYRQNLKMTDAAVTNGLYMRALSRKETVAVMAEVVLEHRMAEREYANTIAIAGVILGASPTFAEVMIMRGSAYGGLLDTEFHQRYRTLAEVPIEQRDRYKTLVEGNRAAFERAEMLGWREPE